MKTPNANIIRLFIAPTKDPVIYYGCKDGSIYVAFTERYLTFEGKKREYIIVKHVNYTFDYESKTVFKRGKPVAPEILDKPPFHLEVIAKSKKVPDEIDDWVNDVIRKSFTTNRTTS